MGYRGSKRRRVPGKPPEASTIQIGSILGNTFSNLGLNAKLREYNIKKAWAKAVGEAIARRAAPERLIGQTLYCNVSNSAWLSELSYQKKAIIEKLGSVLPAGAVTELVLKIGPVAPLRTKTPKKTVERELTPEERSFIEKTTEDVKDTKLKALIKRVMEKSKSS